MPVSLPKPLDEPLFVPPMQRQAPTPSQLGLIEQAVAEIASTADLHPGVTIVHNVLTDTVEYMSARGLRELQTTLPKLRALGEAYFATYFNPDDAADYLPKIYNLVQSFDPDATVSFFQQVRVGGLTASFTWHYVTTRVLLRDPAGPPLLLCTTACSVDPEHHLTHKVSRLLEENNFLRQHAPRYATLTAREREVLRLLALGHSAPEVAAQLFMSPATAETHRRNVRQKLEAESAYELGQYARAFDLI